ncbi:hypothetical protein [Rugosimonospora africana]|uniref:Uncharacterized protein n=1 Tax=Rugosimonospora africana TaxID=556532 RepID=A0A8J3VUC9_9ACTN|nr:hypothetical protein [Rugosimonospora africana]GIH19135.1 hypothetical protein Raf01_73070 [Rugosimonospora africana]
MSRDFSRGKSGTHGRNRPSAALEDTDPMTREDILEAFGPETSSASAGHRPDRTPPDPDLSDDPRPPS